MKVHTNKFKNNIKKLGKVIDAKIVYYNNFNLTSENNESILTETSLKLITENVDYNNPIEILNEDIFKIEIVKNGNLLQSLMKQINFVAKEELNVGTIINVKFGLLVDNEFEYLDYGNYIIKSREFNVDTRTWDYICYDKMLFSMVEYKGLENISFPITINNFVKLLCNKIGLEFYEDENEYNYTNKNELLYEDVYKGKGMTYRDIFDDISELAGGYLLINNDEKVVVGYPYATGDVIDEDYLNETNVKVAQKYGPINSVAISDDDLDLEYVAEESEYIEENGLMRLNIKNNPLVLNGNSQAIAQNILFRLIGLEYYLVDLNSTGICYYDFLDLFWVKFGSQYYQCLLLNDEITIQQGLQEQIFNEEYQEIKTSSENYKTSIMPNNELSFKINQQESKIESRVEKNGVISAINQSAEEIQIEANKISLEGKEINLTSDDIIIDSTNFSVDKNGNMNCNNATANNLKINGGKITLTANSYSDQRFVLKYDNENNNRHYKNAISPSGMIVYDRDNNNYYAYYESAGFNSEISGGYSLSCYPTSVTLSRNNVSNISLDNNDGNVYCNQVISSSIEGKKKNFERLTNAKDILKKVDIYKYNFKDEDDNAKKSIGFVIGDDFNYSQEITSKNDEGVNLYSMISVLWQVVKEQQQEIEGLKEMIKNGKY